MLAVLDVEPTRLHLMIYMSYVCASCMLESGVYIFFVSKSEHKSCTKPTDALRESKVIGPLHILSSRKNNTFWHQQFLQWVGGQLETLSKKLFTYKNSPDFRWLQNLMRPPDMCATYCSFFPFPALATVESIDFIRHASPGGEIDLSFWR